MTREIDVRPVLVQQREKDKADARVGAALRALARFTFPGLEPSSGFATGYNRTREHLGLSPADLAGLEQLRATGHAMRVGRGWCITRKGRALAAVAFGDEAMASELVEEDAAGHPHMRIVEGKAAR